MSEDHRKLQKDKKELPSGLGKRSSKKSLPESMRKSKDQSVSKNKEAPEFIPHETSVRQNASPVSPSFSPIKAKSNIPLKKASEQNPNFSNTSAKIMPSPQPQEKAVPKKTKKDRALLSLQKFKQKFASKKNSPPKDKAKGRIYHSLQDRKSFTLLILGIMVVFLAGIYGLYSLYKSQNQNKWIEELRLFAIPEKVDDFIPKSHPVLIEFINQGSSCIPLFKKLYPNMTPPQKVAVLLILGEFKNPEAMDIWMDALQSNVPLLAKFASRSIAKLQEKAVGPLTEKWKTVAASSKPYFIEAMALTEQPEVLTILLESLQKEDAKTREVTVESLKYFKNKKEIIEPLYSALSDKENSVAEKALEVWEILHREQILPLYAETLSQKTKQAFSSSKLPEVRARLLRFMGILGLCLKKDGDNYISLFKEDVKKAFQEDSLPEKIAAAYILGRFQDEEMLPELILNIESDIPELSQNIAASLASLASPLVPKEILSRKWKSVAHVQKALAKILQDYSIYTIRLDLKEKAIHFLMEMMESSFASSQESIAAALSLYTLEPIDILIFQKDEIKDFKSLLLKIKKGETNLSQYLQKHFSEKNQKALALHDVSKDPSEEVKALLIEEMNRVLCDSKLYSQQRFPEEKPWPPGKEIHFHRFLLEKAFASEIMPALVLSYPDVKNPKNFIKKFVPLFTPQSNDKSYKEDAVDPSDKRDPISRNLWYQLSRETQKLLLESVEKEDLLLKAQGSLLEELNRLMGKSPLYQESLFEKISLTQECKRLLNRKLSKRDTIKLNRLLLELVYPTDISVKGQTIHDSQNIKK